MFRAIRRSALLAVVALVPALPALSQAPVEQRAHNLIGMIDYTKKPAFKVGSWVRYRAEGGAIDGTRQAFHSTILIAGEERFWGDDGFWVESWFQPDGAPTPLPFACLMSYAVFQDSFPEPRMTYYMRKTFGGYDENGRPIEDLIRRNPNSVRVRKWLSERSAWVTDTIGRDTVITPKGTFDCLKLELRRGTGKTEDLPDSTIYQEMRETRTLYMNDAAPITHIVREDIESTTRRRAWKVGQSQEAAPFQILEQGNLSSRVVDFGDSGVEALILPPARRRSLREQYPAEYGSRATSPAAPASRKSSASSPPRR